MSRQCGEFKELRMNAGIAFMLTRAEDGPPA